jgi:hypothetical protein
MTHKISLPTLLSFFAGVIAFAFLTAAPAHGQLQTLRIAIPQKGLFDTTMPTWMALREESLKGFKQGKQ